jgi:transcriptional regulator with XRE-family HTH domain
MSETEKPSPEHWVTVAKISKERMLELGMNQDQLAGKAGLALSIVREIIHNTVQRNRNTRTLEALSVALEFPPRHLWAISRGLEPPAPDPHPNELLVRLASIENKLEPIGSIEDRLAAIEGQLTRVNTHLGTVDGGWSDPHGEHT